MNKLQPLYSKDSIKSLSAEVFNRFQSQLNGIRFIPIKYLLHDVYDQLNLSNAQKSALSSLLLKELESLFAAENYELIHQKRRFNDMNDVDTMVELYNIPEHARSRNGSPYFEKTSNFITIDDVRNLTSNVASSYHSYLNRP